MTGICSVKEEWLMIGICLMSYDITSTAPCFLPSDVLHPLNSRASMGEDLLTHTRSAAVLLPQSCNAVCMQESNGNALDVSVWTELGFTRSEHLLGRRLESRGHVDDIKRKHGLKHGQVRDEHEASLQSRNGVEGRFDRVACFHNSNYLESSCDDLRIVVDGGRMLRACSALTRLYGRELLNPKAL
jgi:hypothetical protein